MHTPLPPPLPPPPPQGWTNMQLDKVKGKVASGVVVGEWSLDFRQYPQYPYTPEQLKALQNLMKAQLKVRSDDC